MRVQALAIRQAMFLPLGAMLALIACGFAVPGYQSVSQHLSEMGLIAGWPRHAEQMAAAICGLSILLFSLSLLGQGRRFVLTGVTSALLGVCMLSNGVFTTGSPLHGMYGVGIFSVLTPLLFQVELGPHASRRIGWVARITSLLGMLYLWAMVTGLDPAAYRGLTQRLALLPAFAWYAFAVLELRRTGR